MVEQLQTGDSQDVPVELDQNRQGRLSRMDAMQGQAMLKAGLNRLRTNLQQVEMALMRIEQPEFGRCDECDGWIAFARLELDPTATLCIACATSLEKDLR